MEREDRQQEEHSHHFDDTWALRELEREEHSHHFDDTWAPRELEREEHSHHFDDTREPRELEQEGDTRLEEHSSHHFEEVCAPTETTTNPVKSNRLVYAVANPSSSPYTEVQGEDEYKSINDIGNIFRSYYKKAQNAEEFGQ